MAHVVVNRNCFFSFLMTVMFSDELRLYLFKNWRCVLVWRLYNQEFDIHSEISDYSVMAWGAMCSDDRSEIAE